MKHAVAGLLLGIVVLVGCDLSGPEASNAVRAIHLEPGSNGVYAWSFLGEDSLGQVLFSETDTFRVVVAAEGEQLGGYDGLARVEVYSLMSYAGTEEIWYRQTRRELIEVAARNAGAVPIVAAKQGAERKAVAPPWVLPRTVALLLEEQAVIAPASAAADSIYIREDPRIVYRYPLEPGRTWTSFEDPFLSTREVVAVETVTVPAGTFECAKIRTRLPSIASDATLVWFDYVSDEGVVLREIERVQVRRDEHGEDIGTFRVGERQELLSKKLAS